MYRSGRLGARALGTFLVARVNAVDAGCTCTVFRSSRCRAVRVVCWEGWMVVRFVFVIRVPVCALVFRVCPVPVCPGSPLCRCKPGEMWGV
jgi:hypothetical protein